LPLDVIGEEVAREPHAAARDAQLSFEEIGEEGQQLGVGVRELGAVPPFRALGPIEHAPAA